MKYGEVIKKHLQINKKRTGKIFDFTPESVLTREFENEEDRKKRKAIKNHATRVVLESMSEQSESITISITACRNTLSEHVGMVGTSHTGNLSCNCSRIAFLK